MRIGELRSKRKEVPTKSEDAFIKSLRLMIQDEVEKVGSDAKPAREPNQPFRRSQLVFILVFALDLALIYVFALDLVGDVGQNRVVVSFAKLLPIVGGTLLVTYLEHVRAGILKLTEKERFGWGCVLLLPFLLAFQVHFYTLFVDLHPERAHVELLEKGAYHDAKFSDPTHRVYLLLPNPTHYTIRLENKWSEYDISAWQVVKGTLARLPALDHYLKPLRMDVLYEVTILSPKKEGVLRVASPETPGMQISKLVKIAPLAPTPATNVPKVYQWEKSFSGTEGPLIYLPSGTYDFTLEVKGCGPKPLQRKGQEIDNSSKPVNFVELCN